MMASSTCDRTDCAVCTHRCLMCSVSKVLVHRGEQNRTRAVHDYSVPGTVPKPSPNRPLQVSTLCTHSRNEDRQLRRSQSHGGQLFRVCGAHDESAVSVSVPCRRHMARYHFV